MDGKAISNPKELAVPSALLALSAPSSVEELAGQPDYAKLGNNDECSVVLRIV